MIHILRLVLSFCENYNEFNWGVDMDYTTVKEASEKWSVTPRRINYYCAGAAFPAL